MRKIQTQFPHHQAACVFPDQRAQLSQAFHELHLDETYSVIVLIGGHVQDEYRSTTQKAIEIVAALAESDHALISCGGSDIGVLASIGRIRLLRRYTFPLIGINEDGFC